jgi:hypothetical protein
MSVYESILSAARDIVDGLALDGVQAVRIRKLPRADEELDELPIIVVAPDDPERVRHAGFESVNVIYTADIVWIGGGGVQALDQVEQVLAFREAVRQAFQGPLLAGVDEVWKTELAPGPAFNRRALNRNYDYSGLRVRFHANEPPTV